MTAIYYTTCKKLSDQAFEKAVLLLPAAMQQNLKKFRRWQDAHADLYGKLLLKEAISALGYNHDLGSLHKTKYGKPYFKDSNFGFNISHSGNYILCVISTDEKLNLGIDIEEIKPIALESFIDVFTDQEKKEIIHKNNFYTFWTRKEAVAKADGRGLIIPFDTIDTLGLCVGLNKTTYNLYEIHIDDKYVIYLAACSNIKNIKQIYKHPDSLY